MSLRFEIESWTVFTYEGQNKFQAETEEEEPIAQFNLLVFTYSADLIFIDEYVNGNQQRCVINKVLNYHEGVEKAEAGSLASKLKEY